MRWREGWVPFAFLAPALVLLLAFRLLPAVSGFKEAFYTSGAIAGTSEFVGLENFSYLGQDPSFWNSLQVTLIFNLVTNPLQVVLAIGLAVLANLRLRGISLFRSIYLLPVAISFNVAAAVWALMLDTNSGLVNGLLVRLGFPAQPFLTSSSLALWAVVAVVSWKAVPFWMLFFLAGLQRIPASVLEAAAVDGATAIQTFRDVTLPLLRRMILFVLVADTIGNFLLFTPIFLLTQGGPAESTSVLMWETYRRGLLWGDLGTAAAMACILLGIVALVVTLQSIMLRER
jgi:ABC-type sugar transport system permease subunit